MLPLLCFLDWSNVKLHGCYRMICSSLHLFASRFMRTIIGTCIDVLVIEKIFSWLVPKSRCQQTGNFGSTDESYFGCELKGPKLNVILWTYQSCGIFCSQYRSCICLLHSYFWTSYLHNMPIWVNAQQVTHVRTWSPGISTCLEYSYVPLQTNNNFFHNMFYFIARKVSRSWTPRQY